MSNERSRRISELLAEGARLAGELTVGLGAALVVFANEQEAVEWLRETLNKNTETEDAQE